MTQTNELGPSIFSLFGAQEGVSNSITIHTPFMY